MMFSLHGVHVPHRKGTVGKPAVKMTPPARVVLPMAMHIGRPAEVCVQVGDAVCVGTMIGAAAGPVSSPVFSSVSGKVVGVQDFLLASGVTTKAVVIESDGAMTVDGSVAPPAVTSRESLLAALASSGIVGLGGAGFPTHVKLNVPAEKIEYLVINGAECEPYVTSDTRTMLTRGEDMAVALTALAAHLGVRRAVIGIEANKPRAIAAMRALAEDLSETLTLTVQVLPAIYPQGWRKGADLPHHGQSRAERQAADRRGVRGAELYHACRHRCLFANGHAVGGKMRDRGRRRREGAAERAGAAGQRDG